MNYFESNRKDKTDFFQQKAVLHWLVEMHVITKSTNSWFFYPTQSMIQCYNQVT